MREQGRRHGLFVLFGLAAGAVLGFVAGYAVRAVPRREAPQPMARAAPATRAAPARAADAPPRKTPPASRTDILAIAVEVNRILEPELDEGKLRGELRTLTARARDAVAEARGADETIAALNGVLLADRKVGFLSNIYWRDASLAAAVLRRKGNCLATATLYVVVGRALGLPVHAIVVPEHVLARYAGQPHRNIETTAGGEHQSDESYRQRRGYGDAEAADFGYGTTLSDDQFAAILLLTAARQLGARRQRDDDLRLIDRAGQLWPDTLLVAFSRAGALYADPARRKDALDFFKSIVSAEAGARSPLALMRAHAGLAVHAHGQGDQPLALRHLATAFALAPRPAQAHILEVMSSCYHTQRDFSAAAVVQELALLLDPAPDKLGSLAITYKNAGRVDDAIRILRRALAENPESWHTRLALAGYLIRAGQAREGWQQFEKVKKPRGNHESYHANLAWFHAAVGNKDELMSHLDKALTLSTSPHILIYIRAEVDFDPYRADPAFKALLEKHRPRLTAAPQAP